MWGHPLDNLSAVAGEEMDLRNGAKEVGYRADAQNREGQGEGWRGRMESIKDEQTTILTAQVSDDSDLDHQKHKEKRGRLL